jgi:hypothetical protein
MESRDGPLPTCDDIHVRVMLAIQGDVELNIAPKSFSLNG